jgi:hypothetical protein
MKTKNPFFSTILFIALLAMVGCKSQKIATEQPQQISDGKETLNPRPANLVFWRESLKKNISKEDVVYFYNSCDIILTGKLPIYKELAIKDGGFVSSDSVIFFERIVPAYTPSRITDMRRDGDGTLLEQTVWFDKNDETYKIHYVMEDYARFLESQERILNPNIKLNPISESGSFILKNKAAIIFKGKEVDADATIKSSDDDRLLVKKTGDVTPFYSTEKAGGRTDGNSTTNTPAPISTQKGIEIKGNTGSKSPYAPQK